MEAIPRTALSAIYPLPEGERIILSVLLRSTYPVSMDRLVDAVYGSRADGGPDVPRQVIRQFLFRLRKRLEILGWTVSKPSGGKGMVGEYRLLPLAPDE